MTNTKRSGRVKASPGLSAALEAGETHLRAGREGRPCPAAPARAPHQQCRLRADGAISPPQGRQRCHCRLPKPLRFCRHPPFKGLLSHLWLISESFVPPAQKVRARRRVLLTPSVSSRAQRRHGGRWMRLRSEAPHTDTTQRTEALTVFLRGTAIWGALGTEGRSLSGPRAGPGLRSALLLLRITMSQRSNSTADNSHKAPLRAQITGKWGCCSQAVTNLNKPCSNICHVGRNTLKRRAGARRGQQKVPLSRCAPRSGYALGF